MSSGPLIKTGGQHWVRSLYQL